ncbi:MAG TPA: outer membrane beta-barrel protein [Terracidiphilus sp.]|nr:outer membrane beta-barrel protein [Terracidiphilus sp.]
MRRFSVVLLAWMLCALPLAVKAQVVPAASRSRLSLTAGGMGSLFQPDYAGGGITGASPNRLYGLGAYVDVEFTRWIQLEAEGRWLRFNQFLDIHQDNYLLGPRVPIHRFGRITPYAKVLFGFGNMNFEFSEASCHCANIAYGGGADVQLTKRLSLRAIDFEYQQWPDWNVYQNGQLHPYGASVGIGYKVF